MTRTVAEILLADAVAARNNLRRARTIYHGVLVAADHEGITCDELAEALGTEAHYVRNTLRLHRAGNCGCQS